ncbi:phage tail fiber-like protein, partial [Ostreococcus tauri]
GGSARVIVDSTGQVGIGRAPEKNLDVQGEGRVSGAFTVGGELSKSSGSFKIDHPLPEMSHTHDLYHSFIEGPRADLIYRGKVRLQNGRATINIDAASNMTFGTFEALNRDVQSFTSNESDWDPVRGSVVGNVLTIECQNPMSTALISWMVIGEQRSRRPGTIKKECDDVNVRQCTRVRNELPKLPL